MDMTRTLDTLLRDGFILVFNQDKLDVVETARALVEAGFNNMEVTCRISQPLAKIERLRKELPDFACGAASLIDSPEMLATYNARHGDDPLPSVEQAADAGASYLVSAANFRPDTYGTCAGTLPLVPGCGTVSEIVEQFGLGANLVKIFPARQLGGPAFAKAIDPAIHKTISLVPTGGTNPDNIPDYIAAGVLVLGGSFSAVPKDKLKQVVEGQDYKLLAGELAGIRRLIDETRARQWPGLDFTTAGADEISKVTGRDFNTGGR